jgi:hypothetical protein
MSEGVSRFPFGYTCGRHLINECLHAIATCIAQDGRPKIVHSLLIRIFKMVQGKSPSGF